VVLNPAVLILTNHQDFSSDWVVRLLRRRNVDVLRLNTEMIHSWAWDVDPVRGSWRISQPKRSAELVGLRGVYYRRPERPRVKGLTRSDSNLVVRQWRALLDGLESIRDVRWVSPPHRIDEAESKIRQLSRATELGFAIPETLITNSRAAATEFVARAGSRVVAKGLSAPILGPSRQPAFVFTTEVDRGALEDLGEPDPAPVILQQMVHPKEDVRVTVVGSRVFAATTTSTSVDWRTQDPPASFQPYQLAADLAERCVEMVSSFGIRFGGIDLAIAQDGEAFFLELNPNGEWGWLEHAGLPIAEAIVDELVGG